MFELFLFIYTVNGTALLMALLSMDAIRTNTCFKNLIVATCSATCKARAGAYI